MMLFQNLQDGKYQTVVAYGTSLTEFGAWTRALQAYFEREFPGRVTVINSGGSGQTSEWGVASLQERVLVHRPDLVFLEFSVNDAAPKNRVSQERSVENLDHMVRALRRQNPRIDIVLQTMNTAWDSPAQEEGKKFASDRPDLDAYYDLYRPYAREHDLPLIDHHTHWSRLQEQDPDTFRTWLPDGLHPIPEASLAVTWPAIEALLEQARHMARTGA